MKKESKTYTLFVSRLSIAGQTNKEGRKIVSRLYTDGVKFKHNVSDMVLAEFEDLKGRIQLCALWTTLAGFNKCIHEVFYFNVFLCSFWAREKSQNCSQSKKFEIHNSI